MLRALECSRPDNIFPWQKRMRLFFLSISAWSLVLVACAPVGPDYRPPKNDLPARWSAQQTTLSPSAANTREPWWGIFNDPLLNRLVSQAIAANQDLAIATSRLKAARARHRIATAAADPTVAAAAAYSQSRSSGNTGASGTTKDLYQAGFDADWELDLFGGKRRAVEAAAATVSASQENVRDVLISLEAEVARNYFELTGGRKRLATARKNLAAQDLTLSTVTGRFQLGLASQLEVAQARTQRSFVAAGIPALEQKNTENLNQLAVLLNRQPAEMYEQLATVAADADPPPILSAGLPSDLLRRRPDIRRAERQLAAATAEVGVATADLFPRFSLSALIGLQSNSLSDLFSSGSRYWSIGPSLNLPIFNRDKLQAAVAISEAERGEMILTYEQTVLTAFVETETLLDRYKREQEARDDLRQAVQTGRQAVSFNEGLYRTGLADLTDVLASQRTLYQTEDQLIQSEQQLLLTAIALYKAVGGGWEIAEKTAAPTSNPPRQKTH